MSDFSRLSFHTNSLAAIIPGRRSQIEQIRALQPLLLDNASSALISSRSMLVFRNNFDAIPIQLVSVRDLAAWRESQRPEALGWLDRAKFQGEANQWTSIPDQTGAPGAVVAGIGTEPDLQSIASLGRRLPVGDYRLADELAEHHPVLAMGWGLGSYRFEAYKRRKREFARLFVGGAMDEVRSVVEAVALSRDLINRPASDMLPEHLERSVREVAEAHDAQLQVTTGDELLFAGYRTIHTVGRASACPPRLLDLRWGDDDYPKVTLLGKGVCFDSGGLDLKTAQGMRSMKKDMAGAATALGLAKLVMAQRLPVRLRLLIPAVENAVSGNAYRPGDVIRTYKNLTVEVGNTDAEGRLILCDALALASEERPELMIDFSTLTGAARVALGSQIAALFCNDNDVADQIIHHGEAEFDPIWRLPLDDELRKELKSPIADLCNITPNRLGGAISAALFLEEFVEGTSWVHFDMNAWNTKSRPLQPVGAEPNGLRAVFRYLEDRYR